MEIKDDEFQPKWKIPDEDLNEEKWSEFKSPAGKPLKNTCKSCRNELIWGKSYLSNFCSCPGSNKKYRYGCKRCRISYCTICCHPPNIKICGCDKELVRSNVYSHRCDLCRDSIYDSCLRCSYCDYDVCNECLEEYK